MVTAMQEITKMHKWFIQNRGVPGQARERAYGGAQLAGGVLMSSILGRGKRTPQEGGHNCLTAFIPLEHDICSDITPHTPSTGDSVSLESLEIYSVNLLATNFRHMVKC